MSRIEIYQDYELAKIALSDGFVKEAQVLDWLTDNLKKMFGSHIDRNNYTRTLVDFLAPAAIGMIAGGLGIPLLGTLIPIASEILHFSVYDTITDLAKDFGDKIQNGQSVSEQEIKEKVQSAVDEKSKDVAKTSSSSYIMSVRSNKLFNSQLKNKTASIAKAPIVKSILVRALSLLFKLVLTASSALVVGEVANTAVGRPSGISGTYQKGNEEGKQTAKVNLKMNDHYSDMQESTPWIVKIPNNSNSIAELLIQLTNEVYENLSSKESKIKSVPAFQATVRAIYTANSTMPDANFVIIPTDVINAHSKKQLVDIFLVQAQDLLK